MAITRRQIKTATAAPGTSVTATLDSPAVAGNLLTVCWDGANADPGTITPPTGFTEATHNQAGANFSAGYLWYKVAAGGETAIQVQTSNSINQDICVKEHQGFVGTPTLDKVANTATSGSTTVTTASTGTTATTTAADELVLAMIALNATGGVIVTTWTNSFADDTGRASTRMYLAEKVVSSTGTQESTLVWTTSRKCVGIVATFKDVSSTAVKTYSGLATASVKTINDLPIASRKTTLGLV